MLSRTATARNRASRSQGTQHVEAEADQVHGKSECERIQFRQNSSSAGLNEKSSDQPFSAFLCTFLHLDKPHEHPLRSTARTNERSLGATTPSLTDRPAGGSDVLPWPDLTCGPLSPTPRHERGLEMSSQSSLPGSLDESPARSRQQIQSDPQATRWVDLLGWGEDLRLD